MRISRWRCRHLRYRVTTTMTNATKNVSPTHKKVRSVLLSASSWLSVAGVTDTASAVTGCTEPVRPVTTMASLTAVASAFCSAARPDVERDADMSWAASVAEGYERTAMIT